MMCVSASRVTSNYFVGKPSIHVRPREVVVARQGKETYIFTHSKLKLDQKDFSVFGIAPEGYKAKQSEIKIYPD